MPLERLALLVSTSLPHPIVETTTLFILAGFISTFFPIVAHMKLVLEAKTTHTKAGHIARFFLQLEASGPAIVRVTANESQTRVTGEGTGPTTSILLARLRAKKLQPAIVQCAIPRLATPLW